MSLRRVVIAGSGIAALECALALRDLAGERVSIELLAPAAELVHRPSSVTTPFGGPPAARIDLTRLAAELGFRLHRDALAEVDAAAHRVSTRGGGHVPYDTLVVATGARSADAVPGAVTFRGPLSAGVVEQAVESVLADPERRLAFAAPSGARWLLPLYELALLSAAALREDGVADPDITVATPEHQPLEVFGPAASEALRAALDRADITLVTSAAAAGAVEGVLRLESGELLSADVVVALPRLVGPRIPGLPHDANGFRPVDEHGHVGGAADVFAAGDATDFPVKHGGIAAQQADAVAEAVAAQLGAIVMPEPFRPVMRGLLLTGDRPLYLRVELGAGGRSEHRLLPAPGAAAADALWWPPGKVAGRYLTPFLVSGGAGGAPLQDREPEGAEGLDLIVLAAEQDAAAGDYESAVRTLDDAEAWLGPLPAGAAEHREAWRRLISPARA